MAGQRVVQAGTARSGSPVTRGALRQSTGTGESIKNGKKRALNKRLGEF